MFYVRPNHPYYAPRYAYPSSSYYAQPEPEPRISQEELARERYLKALREQQAARKAYADAVAERELRRMEEQYGAEDPYARYGFPATQRPRFQQRYFDEPEEDDEEEDYARNAHYDKWSDAIRARALEQERARALEQERAREIAAEHERQRLRAAQLAAEQERQRALAAAEEQRRQAHAYKQAQAYADALQQKQMNSKQSNRKLGRVTPDVRPVQEKQSTPVRIPIRSRSPPRPAPAPAPSPAQSTATSKPEPEPAPATPEPTTALTAIAAVESTLSKLREAFSLPSQLEFKAPRELSFSMTNAPVRAYEYELGKLLEKLDEVESAGVAEIRKERKRVVELVEGALGELEQKLAEEWRKTHPEEEAPNTKDDEKMDVEHADAAPATVAEDRMDVEPAAAELPPSEPAVVEPANAEHIAVEPAAESLDSLPASSTAATAGQSSASNSMEVESAVEPTAVPPAAEPSPSSSAPEEPASGRSSAPHAMDIEPSPASSESSQPAGSSDPAVSLDNSHDGMDVEPTPPSAPDASEPVRISITQDVPAPAEAQSVPVVDAQPVRIHIDASDSPSHSHDIAVTERSDAHPSSTDVQSESSPPLQRTDEFEMV